MKPIVIIESPFANPDPVEAKANMDYLSDCLHDSLCRGEAPFASHAIYTLPGVLDDSVPEERDLGIHAGFEFHRVADYMVVYTDRGISSGMGWGVKSAMEIGLPVIYRTIRED